MSDNETLFIVFDLFGVLLTRGLESSKGHLARMLKRSPEDIARVYKKWEHPFDTGSIGAEEFWNHVQHELNTGLPWAALNECVLKSYRRIPGSFELIQECKKYGSLALLSNTRTEWYEYLDAKFGISRHFEHRFISSELHLTKPEKEIYELVIRSLNARPEKIIYVDDDMSNITAAVDEGIQSILFENVDETRKVIMSVLNSREHR